MDPTIKIMDSRNQSLRVPLPPLPLNGVAAVLVTFLGAALSTAFGATLGVRDFEGHGVTLTQERYRGREAIKVIESESAGGTADTIAVLKGATFHNGTIE